MKRVFSFLTLLLLIIPFSTMASEDYVCDNHGDKRIITIAYHNDELPVPCEVRYDKGEGSEILWVALIEAGFCEARANELIEKQESRGWNCNRFELPANNDEVNS